MDLLSRKPDQNAPKSFPSAARANHALFFGSSLEAIRKRKALSIAEVHERIDAMIEKRVARYASLRQNLVSRPSDAAFADVD